MVKKKGVPYQRKAMNRTSIKVSLSPFKSPEGKDSNISTRPVPAIVFMDCSSRRHRNNYNDPPFWSPTSSSSTRASRNKVLKNDIGFLLEKKRGERHQFVLPLLTAIKMSTCQTKFFLLFYFVTLSLLSQLRV
ncbi:hypothetical protein CDAR_109351 [Caerostris darwini]|uniref:Uncharacterized protein n=1 Tax=Caerostris darwini TaxID=1538125 RepID=A0AAV4TRV7_9ARAC|nr:hypothetical protein CDAR_109351 [Caerostris darwini]